MGDGETGTTATERERRLRHDADRVLVQRVLTGKDGALDELRRRLACIPAMVRHHNRKLGTPLRDLDVEEAVSETVAAIWEKLPTFEGRAALETWAYRFAFLEVLKTLRRIERAPRALEDEPQVAEPLPLAALEPPFDRAQIDAGLGELSRGASEVIRKRIFEEQSFEHIAGAFGLPLNTVKARYYRGLARLREILERRKRRERP